MKRCIFTVIAIAALLFIMAGSLSAQMQNARNSTECLSIFNKKVSWQAKGAILFPYYTDETICSCMEYCEDSNLDSETCNVLKESCTTKQLKQAIKNMLKNMPPDRKLAIQPPSVNKATLDTETICAYLFNSALEKDMSFTENIPCSCSLYCNSSNISEKVMCESFNFFCALSAFRGENDDPLPMAELGKKLIQLRPDSKKLDSITVNQEIMDVPSNEIQTKGSLSSCIDIFVKYSNEKDYDSDALCSCASEYPEIFSSPSILMQCGKEEIIKKLEGR